MELHLCPENHVAHFFINPVLYIYHKATIRQPLQTGEIYAFNFKHYESALQTMIDISIFIFILKYSYNLSQNISRSIYEIE